MVAIFETHIHGSEYLEGIGCSHCVGVYGNVCCKALVDKDSGFIPGVLKYVVRV